MRATSIQLYSRTSTDDEGNAAYCGCYFVPCPDGDPRIPDLERLNLGRARDTDGTVTRAFFFADEIGEMIAQAARVTECDVVTPWEYPVDTTAARTADERSRPSDVVTYFGGYAAAIRAGDRFVHIYRDGDERTFCGVVGDLSYGTPRQVGQLSRSSCLSCFSDCQQVRRDV